MGNRRWGKMFDRCPFCGNSLFLVGPFGGLATNFKCMECSATFNDLGPFGVELIGAPGVLIEAKEEKREPF